MGDLFFEVDSKMLSALEAAVDASPTNSTDVDYAGADCDGSCSRSCTYSCEGCCGPPTPCGGACSELCSNGLFNDLDA